MRDEGWGGGRRRGRRKIKIVCITAQWLGALSAGEGAPPPGKVHGAGVARAERLGARVWNALEGQSCVGDGLARPSSRSLGKRASSPCHVRGTGRSMDRCTQSRLAELTVQEGAGNELSAKCAVRYSYGETVQGEVRVP